MSDIHEETMEELLEMYYEDSYDDIVFKRSDDKKIVAEDSKINNTIAVDLE